MRESLFSTLGRRIVGTRVCDLYAGCGSVGIEALSRGAARTVFMEKEPGCVEAIERNLANTHLTEPAVVVRADVLVSYARVCAEHGPFQVVFADPPYGCEQLVELARRLVVEGEGVAADGIVVLQHDTPEELVGLPPPVEEKRFGHSVLSFFERADGGARSQ